MRLRFLPGESIADQLKLVIFHSTPLKNTLVLWICRINISIIIIIIVIIIIIILLSLSLIFRWNLFFSVPDIVTNRNFTWPTPVLVHSSNMQLMVLRLSGRDKTCTVLLRQTPGDFTHQGRRYRCERFIRVITALVMQ